MKGLALLIGKPDGKPDDEAESAERSYAREAFSAMKDDDEEGFVEAFLGAVRACKSKAKSDEYEDDEE
jgi:hypothetical protein